MILKVAPGQLPKTNTPHKAVTINCKAVVIGITLDDPTSLNALKDIICPKAQPAPDNKDKKNCMPVGIESPEIII